MAKKKCQTCGGTGSIVVWPKLARGTADAEQEPCPVCAIGPEPDKAIFCPTCDTETMIWNGSTWTCTQCGAIEQR